MTRVGQDKIEEVRARADIVEIIGVQVRLRRAGRNFVGLCPFHNEKTPSFTVSAERGFFHCFGCGAGGTVFDFVMRTEGLTFPEALQMLANRYRITLPVQERGGPAASEREAMARANQTAAEFFAHVLWNTEDGTLARDYLKKRGIMEATARHFLLGFAPARPANLTAVLNKRGLIEAGLQAGLIRHQGAGESASRGQSQMAGESASRDQSQMASGAYYDMFRARLIFPIRDAQGRIIAFGGRVLDQRLPKYINSPESPLYSKARALYGIHEARQAIAAADRALVVEGYLDAIALWQADFKESVATLGTALTAEQLRMLSRYSRNIVACFDGDEAGRKASLRALEVFLQAGLLGKGIFIPPGYDPDTLVRERGAEAMRELVTSAELLIDYFVREQVALASESLTARARAAERVAEVLSKISNPFEFDLLARKAAGKLAISEELLRKHARRGLKIAVVRAESAPVASVTRKLDAISEAEIGLVTIAMRFPELRVEVAAEAPAQGFDDSLLGAVYDEILNNHGEVSESELLGRLSEAHRERLSALMVGSSMEDTGAARALAISYANSIVRRNRDRVVEGLTRSAANGNEQDAIRAAQAVIALRRETRDH